MWFNCSVELQHNKTNKMTCVPGKDSDQPGHPPSRISLHWVHEETLDPLLLIERTAKALIRPDGCPGWSASLLGAQVILLVFSWCGSIINCIEESWCHMTYYMTLFCYTGLKPMSHDLLSHDLSHDLDLFYYTALKKKHPPMFETAGMTLNVAP